MCGGVDPSRLSLWEYQALVWNWNDRHASPDDKTTDASKLPDREQALAAIAARKAKC